MKFGVAIFPTESIQPPDEIAVMAEERGFECLLFPEHTHIPASRESVWPGGGELPSWYSRTFDPFVACMAAAAATERLLIGTGICLVIERDPVITAKEVASVDVLSGGRFLFGVGAGWNTEEMRNHGTEPSRRFSVMRERIEAMKAIWTQDEASYSGKYVGFERIWSWPKPVQKPHPPVLVGGDGPRVLDRVIAYGASRDRVVETLYLATLSRRPTGEERELMAGYIAKRATPEQGYAGVLWILLNSGEFVLNH